MSAIINETEIESMLHNGVEVQTWIHNDVEVYSAGKMVTYYVDTDVVYQEKIKKGHSCLSPATFTPTKSGWTFVGWREDAVASGSVLSEKTMERSPITLYAVFSQTVTATYNGNGNTGGSTSASTGNKYYNNGNVENASIKLANNSYSKTNYGFTKWAMGSTSGTQYEAGSTVTLSDDTMFYAIWKIDKKYLFKAGTGKVVGWVSDYSSPASLTINSSYMYMLSDGNTGQCMLVSDSINISEYEYLCVDVNQTLRDNNHPGHVDVGLHTYTDWSSDFAKKLGTLTNNVSRQVVKYDIKSLTGNYRTKFWSKHDSGAYGTNTWIYNVWLE